MQIQLAFPTSKSAVQAKTLCSLFVHRNCQLLPDFNSDPFQNNCAMLLKLNDIYHSLDRGKCHAFYETYSGVDSKCSSFLCVCVCNLFRLSG